MNLKLLKDSELLAQTKVLIQQERRLLTKILQHLCEVERRRLFCDLGYQSLFEYAVKELNYSEGQAGRRIQAMRLIKELPELEVKIASGALSLSNISQAQSYFRAAKTGFTSTRSESEKNDVSKFKKIGAMKPSEKLKILESLENKSARDAQKILTALLPEAALPQERERQISQSHLELRLVISNDLRKKLEEVRSLMGVHGVKLGTAELIEYMASLSIEALKDKKFGKKRGLPKDNLQKRSGATITPTSEAQCGKVVSAADLTVQNPVEQNPVVQNPVVQTQVEKEPVAGQKIRVSGRGKAGRYIPQVVQHLVWQRDRGECCKCRAKRNLNIDHILPVALGGGNEVENLRLLCFFCNQRAAMKVFGVDAVGKHVAHRLVGS